MHHLASPDGEIFQQEIKIQLGDQLIDRFLHCCQILISTHQCFGCYCSIRNIMQNHHCSIDMIFIIEQRNCRIGDDLMLAIKAFDLDLLVHDRLTLFHCPGRPPFMCGDQALRLNASILCILPIRPILNIEPLPRYSALQH